MAQFGGRYTYDFDSPQIRQLATQFLPAWGSGGPVNGQGGYWDFGPDNKPIYKQYLQDGTYHNVPFSATGGEGATPWAQDVNAFVGKAIQNGALTPQQFVDVMNSQLGNAKAALNPDGTISYDSYSYDDEGGFLDKFMESPTAPLAMFGGLMGAVGGFGDLFSSFGGGSSGAAGGAMDMGVGGVGEAMGLGNSAGTGALGLADAPWGVNPGGGMNYADFLEEFGFTPDAGSAANIAQMAEYGFLPNGVNAPAGLSSVNNFGTGGLSSLINSLGGTSNLTKLIPSLLGVAGSAAQNKALEGLVGTQAGNRDALLAFGAPYRQRLAGLYDNPSSFLNSQEVQVPVQQATDAVARALSTQGNPIGNGTALQELQNYSANQLFSRLGQEKDRLAGFGGLTQYNNAGAQAFNDTRAQQALAQGEGNIWNALGYGLNQVFNPQPTLADLLKEFKGYNPANSLT